MSTPLPARCPSHDQLQPEGTGLSSPAEADDLRNLPETVIVPRHGWAPLQVDELRHHHELLLLLVQRNVKIRYKQTSLGLAWAVLQPLITVVIFTLVFGRLAGLSSEGSPYALFSFAALVPWVYFSNALTQASTSLVENERLITRIYFPRLLIPLASVLAGLLDLALAFAVLVLLMCGYGVYPAVEVLAAPFFALLAAAAALAAATWLSALNVFYRDVRYVVLFGIQCWLFVTPVVYSTSLLPQRLLPLYALNPMVGVVDGFRWSLLGGVSTIDVTLPLSLLMTAVMLVGGLYYFRRVEDSFADAV
jgi:lipopolysaccharide transport system permease protein